MLASGPRRLVQYLSVRRNLPLRVADVSVTGSSSASLAREPLWTIWREIVFENRVRSEAERTVIRGTFFGWQHVAAVV